MKDLLLAWRESKYAKKGELIQEDLHKLASTSEDLELQNYVENSEDLKIIFQKSLKLEQVFEWIDGPLVSCMKNGGVLLIDEISLA